MAVNPAVLAYITAGVLVAAGLFQASPLKQVCLRHCRSPLGFLMGHWRAGWRGGLAMGWAHACYCLGCCWALMVVLVVAGAMGLPWVLLIACVVAAEKLLPGGQWIARATVSRSWRWAWRGRASGPGDGAPRGGGVTERSLRAWRYTMARAQWQISGEYFEACSCDSVCPCPTSGLAAKPTKGACDAGLVFNVQRGQYGTTTLDGLSFAVLPAHAGRHDPGQLDGRSRRGRARLEGAARRADGDRQRAGRRTHGGARAAHRQLRRRRGQDDPDPEHGGCTARSRFPGSSTSPWMAFRGPRTASRSGSTNVGHPAASRLALAKATRGHMHAFGINWDDTSGRNNGHFAPFAWKS
jgi:hypothetical protein